MDAEAFAFALQQMRQGDKGAQGCGPAAAKRQVGVEISGLVAITALDGRRERPSEIAVSCEGKQKSANELAICEPNGISGLACLEGEDVDEDGFCVAKENVEWGGVLEDQTGGERFFAKVEGQLACSGPLTGRPLPGIGRILDALVLEQKRAVGVAARDDGGDHAAPVHPFARNGGAEKGLYLRHEGGADVTNDFGLIKVKRARRIAKSSAGRDGACSHCWIS